MTIATLLTRPVRTVEQVRRSTAMQQEAERYPGATSNAVRLRASLLNSTRNKVDRLAQMAVLVRVAPSAELRHRRTLIGLSYSSFSTATDCPVRLRNALTKCPKRSREVPWRVPMPV